MRPARPLLPALVLALAGTGVGGAATVLRTAGEVSPLGWPYSTFGEGIVDRGGRLVFAASSTAVFGHDGGALAQRLGAGTVVPDGRRVATVGTPSLAADGCVVARVAFDHGGEAIARACGATISLLVDAGTAAPGGGTIRAFDVPVFVTGTDVVACSATLEGGTSVLLRLDGGGLTEVARSGRPSPSGGAFASFRLLGVSGAGRVAFRATVSGGPDGLFAADGIALAPVVLVGQASPIGGTYESIGGGSLADNDLWAFRAGLSSGDTGIFTIDASAVVPRAQRLVLQGDAVPLAGGSIRSFPGSIDPSINAAGAVAFRALLENADAGSGTFVATPGGGLVALAATRTEIAPGKVVRRLRDPVLADDGSAVVWAAVGGDGPGLFVARPGRALAPLARLGDPTDADTGDSRFGFSDASVTVSAESAVFLGRRDAVFRAGTDGRVEAVAYTGAATPLGGELAQLGPPVLDGRDTVLFGADIRGGRFNEALFVHGGKGLASCVSPDRRILGGGGIRELFPTDVDTLARPAGARRGAVLAAALQGARAAAALVLFPTCRRAKVVARSGQRASGDRLAAFGTPVASGQRMAFLAEIGREQRRIAVVTREGGRLRVVATVGVSTRTRVEGVFAGLGPPALGRRGAVFRGALAQGAVEGIFIARGRRTGAVVATGDATLRGDRIRTVDDPIAVDDEVYFLARTAGSVAPAGLYRVRVGQFPQRDDPALAVEPVLLPGDAVPAPVGGTVVHISAPRVGPGGVVTAVVEVGGGTAASAIVLVDRG